MRTVAPNRRRRALAGSLAAVAAFGMLGAAVPFLASLRPSARARAGGAPVQVDLSRLAPGQQLTVEWRGKPAWVLRRTQEMLRRLDAPAHRARLRDPDSRVVSQQPAYARNGVRALRREYLVLVGVCTHFGCVPLFRPRPAPRDLGADWPGGYFCPCHGSRFDLAGRVYRAMPAPTKLVVPPHRYLGADVVEIGRDPV